MLRTALGELNVEACARALAYLAGQNAAVTWQDLMGHCPQLPWPRLRDQLSLLGGVLFLGEDEARLTLMDPFRLRLRWMLEQEPARTRPEPTPQAVPVNEPETLSAFSVPARRHSDVHKRHRVRQPFFKVLLHHKQSFRALVG